MDALHLDVLTLVHGTENGRIGNDLVTRILKVLTSPEYLMTINA